MKKIITTLLILSPILVFTQGFNIKPIDPKESFNNFLKSESTIKWNKKELKEIAAQPIRLGMSEKRYCVLATKELSRHINYLDFKKMTDYQQGKLMGQLLNYIENKYKP